MVALEQSEPLGHVHYLIYPIDYLRIYEYLGQMMAKGNTICNLSILPRPGSCTAKPKVTPVIRKVKCKKYPKALWNSMSKEAGVV